MLKLVILTALICIVRANDENAQDPDFSDPQVEGLNPYPPEEISEPGQEDGLSRYMNKDILIVSWVPFPIDQWDYVVLNLSDPSFNKESGRASLRTFTRSYYPDVAVAFASSPGDRDYFYNEELDVPVIGVDPFQTDKIFLDYLANIYTIHGFQSLPELWAHFIRYQDAFLPVIGRISQQFQTYLEQWQPRNENDYLGSSGTDTGDFDSGESYESLFQRRVKRENRSRM